MNKIFKNENREKQWKLNWFYKNIDCIENYAHRFNDLNEQYNSFKKEETGEPIG